MAIVLPARRYRVASVLPATVSLSQMRMFGHTSPYDKQAFASRVLRPAMRSQPQVPRITLLIVSNETFYAHASVSIAIPTSVASFATSWTKA